MSRTRSAVLAALLVAVVPTAAVQTAAGFTPRAKGGQAPSSPLAGAVGLRAFDARASMRTPPPMPATAEQISARARLSAELGRQGVLQYDPRTNTARVVARLDGYLTGPSTADPADIALAYVRGQRAALGLTLDDLTTLRLVRRYTDTGGTTHLVWGQVRDGITVFGQDLHANVDRDGRLINVSGAPVSGLALRDTSPRLSAGAALGRALENARSAVAAPRALSAKASGDRETKFAGGHRARLALVAIRPGEVRLAWRVLARKSSQEIYDDLVDAASGQVLTRENTVKFGYSAYMYAWLYAPGIQYASSLTTPPTGGTQDNRTVSGLVTPSWSWSALIGTAGHVYTDIDDDNRPDSPSANCEYCGEQSQSSVPQPGIPVRFGWPFANVLTWPYCSSTFPQCSWSSAYPNWSWTDNVRQNAAQVYYFLSTFHDWLRDQAGFTSAAGNFEYEGGDEVQAEVFDGAATDAGYPGTPDDAHINNANMAAGEDGQPPRMQMYLFYGWPYGRPDANGGDDASIVFHEYVHGFSLRTVTDGSNQPALDGDQGGAMGEGWSDWYAMDYLEGTNLDERDDPARDGQMNMGIAETGNAAFWLRNESLDCHVGSSSGSCAGGPGGSGPGGFTYGDLGHIDAGGPEVHADGEIWAQTLWELRQVVGAPVARRVISDSLRLAPPFPSMLDMRNAIIQAAEVAYGGTYRSQLWGVFARRGMGFFASTADAADTQPLEDFTAGPPAGNASTLAGHVTDQDTGAPVTGAVVEIAGHNSGLPGDYVATTDASGAYAVAGVAPGRYALVFASAPGYDGAAQAVTVGTGGTVQDWQLRRDWAAQSGGASIAFFTGPDFTTNRCGPGNLIDGSLGSGWASTSQTNPEAPGPKSIVIKLPTEVDVSSFALDPGAACGDGDSASLGSYLIETSSDGSTWATALSGAMSSANNHRLNETAATTAKDRVRFVRLTMQAPQRQTGDPDAQDGDVSGRLWMDSSELEVYGKASPPPPPPPPPIVAVVDKTAPRVTLAIPRGQRLRAVLKKGLRVTVRCNEPCSIAARAAVDGKTARKLHLTRNKKARTVTVASGKLGLKGGKRTVTLRFTKRAVKSLAHVRKVKLSVRVVASDASRNRRSVAKVLTLRR